MNTSSRAEAVATPVARDPERLPRSGRRRLGNTGAAAGAGHRFPAAPLLPA